MFKFITFILILQTSLTFSQRNSIHIFGKAWNEEDSLKKIYGLRAKITFNDSLFIETDSDTLGQYSFYISPKLLNTFKAKLSVYQDKEILKKSFPPPVDCPHWYTRPDEFLYEEMKLPQPKEKLTDFQINFGLNRIVFDYRMPRICFEKNNTKLIHIDDNSDTSIYCLKNVLIKNPSIIIELSGHSWSEHKVKKLSIQRAELVKQRLISYGIDSLRIVAVGYSDSQPLITTKVIKRAKTKVEKEALNALNRRLEFKILSWDYDPIFKRRNSKELLPPEKKIDHDDDE